MWTGRRVEELPTPAFTVDLDVVKRNIQRMSERCGALGVGLRPHMKTHKTLEGGVLMTGGTKRRIVVSTLAEARFFADGGFDDILYAYPLPFDKVDECVALAERLESFHVLVDSPEALNLLKRRSLNQGRCWKVWLKIDCGNGRAGLRHDDPATLELAKAIAEGATELAGIYAHCGNSYHCHGVSEIQSVARATTLSTLMFLDMNIVASLDGSGSNTPLCCWSSGGHKCWSLACLYDPQVVTAYLELPESTSSKREGKGMSACPPQAFRLQQAGVACPISSIGSTPSCSHPVPEMAKLQEVHPGNYIFYDVQQMMIGSCQLEDVAVRVLTRVIGHYPHRSQLLVDCGWTGLSLHSLGQLPTGYALVEGHPNLKLVGMTQEHGKIETISGNMDFTKYPLGSLLALIPYHACATAAMHPLYYVHSSGHVVATWKPVRGW